MIRTVCAVVVGLGLMAATAGAQTQAQIELGKQVYAAQKCQICHAIGAVGNNKGPLDDVVARLSADEIRQWVVSAPEMAAKAKATRKPAMKAYPNIGKADLDALVAYLHSLKKKT
jgi:mono/diheme cytochrome c family protein